MEIFVSGIGTVNSIGLSAEESFNSLQSENHGLHWSAEDKMMLGSVAISNEEISLQLEGDFTNHSRSSMLGILAASEAWGENRISNSIKTGLISSTSVGELDISESIYKKVKEGAEIDNNTLTQEAGRTTEQIADSIGLTGFVNTISTACSSGANAILMGARLIQSGRFDRMLVGGVDTFCLHNKKGFTALNICDPQPCKPFDKNRNGLNLGEGAGYLVLENRKSLSITKNKVLCGLSGWANTADAYHQTATSPNGEGAILSMEKALKQAKLMASEIDYINAHGTGTPNNDLTESKAIQHIFGNQTPPFSSTKTYTGHTLAAAGAIEAVFCVLGIVNQFAPKNLRFVDKIDEVNIKPINENKNLLIKHVLSNSFGFGGNCSSLIFSRK